MHAPHIPQLVVDEDSLLREVNRCDNKMQQGDGCPLEGILKEGDRNMVHCLCPCSFLLRS